MLTEYEGTFRNRSPSETLALLRPLLAGFGISRLANVTWLDTVGVPVWMCVRPLARSLSVSQGKGLTHEAAQVSAAMESIELHFAEHFVGHGELISLRESLVDERCVDFTEFSLRASKEISFDRPVRWINAEDIVDGRRYLVPREIVDRDSLLSNSLREDIFYSSSNGLASGNTLGEALLHGLCELVERDQTSFWIISREIAGSSMESRVKLDTITDPVCAFLVNSVRTAGLCIAVWYMSTTINVPCFSCTIWDDTGSTWFPQRASGFGCHPVKRIALSRAITEALQSRLTHIAGSRDDMYWNRFTHDISVDLNENREFIRSVNAESESVSFIDIGDIDRIDFEDRAAIEWMLQVLRRDAGLERALFVDLSLSVMPFSVVHVFVPGLEMSAKKQQYVPGRRMQQFIGGKAPF